MNSSNSIKFENNELMNPGHLGCPGCGATIAMKFALQALGEKTMIVIPACCWGVIAGAISPKRIKRSRVANCFCHRRCSSQRSACSP